MGFGAESKIRLSNIFGKASALISVASSVAILGAAGTVWANAASTATQNPDITTPFVMGLAALGVSLGSGALGYYLGNAKKRLIYEFNEAVARREGKMLADNGQEIQRSDTRYFSSSPGYYYHDDGFWRGYWLGSLGNNNNSSSSSSGSSKNSKDAAAALAVIALVAAAGAAFYVSYKSMKANFGKSPQIIRLDESLPPSAALAYP
jgi:hypothetical protein